MCDAWTRGFASLPVVTAASLVTARFIRAVHWPFNMSDGIAQETQALLNTERPLDCPHEAGNDDG